MILSGDWGRWKDPPPQKKRRKNREFPVKPFAEPQFVSISFWASRNCTKKGADGDLGFAWGQGVIGHGDSGGGGRCDDWGSFDNGSGDRRGWGAAAAQAGELEQHDQGPEAKLAQYESGKVAMNSRLLKKALISEHRIDFKSDIPFPTPLPPIFFLRGTAHCFNRIARPPFAVRRSCDSHQS